VEDLNPENDIKIKGYAVFLGVKVVNNRRSESEIKERINKGKKKR